MPRRRVSSFTDLPAQAKTLAEIGANASAEIEPVTGGLAMDAAALEAFMQEEVVVYLHPGREKDGDLHVITPTVNGINQSVIRGQDQAIKRKYVEAMFRAHAIDYEQIKKAPNDPDSMEMKPKVIPSYPFDIREDSEKGYAWFRGLQEKLKQEIARM